MKRSDYPALAVEAARSVLLELGHLLGQYRQHIVVVGGWVPVFLCPEPEEPHVAAGCLGEGGLPSEPVGDTIAGFNR